MKKFFVTCALLSSFILSSRADAGNAYDDYLSRDWKEVKRTASITGVHPVGLDISIGWRTLRIDVDPDAPASLDCRLYTPDGRLAASDTHPASDCRMMLPVGITGTWKLVVVNRIKSRAPFTVIAYGRRYAP